MIPDWVAPYMRLEWDAASMNCWTLVRKVLGERYGIAVPSYADEYRDAEDGEGAAWAVARHAVEWQAIAPDAGRPGDLALFRVFGLPQHLGVLVAPLSFLHIEKGAGPSLERLDGLRWRSRLLGLYRHPALTEPA